LRKIRGLEGREGVKHGSPLCLTPSFGGGSIGKGGPKLDGVLTPSVEVSPKAVVLAARFMGGRPKEDSGAVLKDLGGGFVRILRQKEKGFCSLERCFESRAKRAPRVNLAEVRFKVIDWALNLLRTVEVK